MTFASLVGHPGNGQRTVLIIDTHHQNQAITADFTAIDQQIELLLTQAIQNLNDHWVVLYLRHNVRVIEKAPKTVDQTGLFAFRVGHLFCHLT